MWFRREISLTQGEKVIGLCQFLSQNLTTSDDKIYIIRRIENPFNSHMGGTDPTTSHVRS